MMTVFKRQVTVVSGMVFPTTRSLSLGFMMVLTVDTSDDTDPEVIIKIDISNVFNNECRVLTLDVLSGYDSRD
jgi:hypothetical protein